MIKEEAIKILKIERGYYCDLKGCKEQQALTMAIKALEREPCGDVISREKAKQFLYEKLDRLNDNELYDIFSRIIDDMYNELPPVTPQQKVGKWEIMACDLYMCSKCYGKYTYKSNFCPNCGCRMKGEDE